MLSSFLNYEQTDWYSHVFLLVQKIQRFYLEHNIHLTQRVKKQIPTNNQQS